MPCLCFKLMPRTSQGSGRKQKLRRVELGPEGPGPGAGPRVSARPVPRRRLEDSLDPSQVRAPGVQGLRSGAPTLPWQQQEKLGPRDGSQSAGTCQLSQSWPRPGDYDLGAITLGGDLTGLGMGNGQCQGGESEGRLREGTQARKTAN